MKFTKKQSLLLLSTVVIIVISAGVFVFYKMYFQKAEKHDFGVPFLNVKSAWVDSLVENMSIEEKIGQLIIIHNTKTKNADIDSIKHWIKNYGIGGLRFQTDSLSKQLKFVNDHHLTSSTHISHNATPDQLRS